MMKAVFAQVGSLFSGFLLAGFSLCLWAQPSASQAAAPPPPSALAAVDTLVNAGHLPQAEAAARAYLAQHENSAPGRYLLAFILFREDKPLLSLAEYTRAAQVQTPTSQQLQCVALDYVLASDYVDADKWMTRATQWTPGDGEAWYSLGRIKYTENRFAEAINCFHRALALTPRSVKVENNLGLAYEGLDRETDALVAYRQAITWQQQLPPQPPDPVEQAQPYINLGTLLLQQNDVPSASAALLRAESLDPTDTHLCMTMGKLYDREGNFSAAQQQFERAVALAPKNASYHFLLGQVYRKLGQPAKARVEFAKAAQLNGTHSSD